MTFGAVSSVVGIASGVMGIANGLSGSDPRQATQAADPFAPYRARLGALYAGYLEPGAHFSGAGGGGGPTIPATPAPVTAAGIPANDPDHRSGRESDSWMGGWIPPSSPTPTAGVPSNTGGSMGAFSDLPGYGMYQTGVMDPALEALKRTGAASGMLMSGNELEALQKTGQQGYYAFMTDYLNRLAQGSGAVNNPAPAASLGYQQANLSQAGVMQGLGGLGTSLAGIGRQFGGGGSNAGLMGPGPYGGAPLDSSFNQYMMPSYTTPFEM